MKQKGDLKACLLKTIHHTDMSNIAAMIELGSSSEDWQYRADLIRTNIEAAQKQAEVLMTTVQATSAEHLQELLEGILQRLRASLSYFNEIWKDISRIVIILYVRTEVSVASLQLDLFTSWVDPEKDQDIHAVLTAEVVEFGHDE
ncbi:MAG TPA: hypothetical protein VLG69_01300 [Candidatus Andersenbacteria bacterium]|nr:hypothetical protein [Candidatus Andersenbacteria bacterium]